MELNHNERLLYYKVSDKMSEALESDNVVEELVKLTKAVLALKKIDNDDAQRLVEQFYSNMRIFTTIKVYDSMVAETVRIAQLIEATNWYKNIEECRENDKQMIKNTFDYVSENIKELKNTYSKKYKLLRDKEKIHVTSPDNLSTEFNNLLRFYFDESVRAVSHRLSH